MKRTCKRFMFFMVLAIALMGMNATVALAKQSNSVRFLTLRDISLSQYRPGIYNEALTAKYSGKYMIVELAIINNTKYAWKRTFGSRVIVYYNNRRILNKKIPNRSFKIGQYSIKKMKLKVQFSKKKQKAFPLSAQAMRIVLGGGLKR